LAREEARASHVLNHRTDGFVELDSDCGNRGKEGGEGDEECIKVEEVRSAKRAEPRIKRSACRDVFITEKRDRLSRWTDMLGNTNQTRPALLRRLADAIRIALELVGYYESAHHVPAIVLNS